MNQSKAQAMCNPQALDYEPKVTGGNWQKGASYDEALGFQSSCHGVSCLAHYCLMPGGDKVSRKECAREIARTLGIVGTDLIEVEIECWVNRSMSYSDVGVHECDVGNVLKYADRPRVSFPEKKKDWTEHQKFLKELYAIIDSLKPSVIELLPFIGKVSEVRTQVAELLMSWENEWMRKLGETDSE